MKRISLALTLAIALLVVPAAAQARDRDHDKLPDKWEKKFHISTHSNSARKDPDRDGLNNRSEFRLRMNPRHRDSDHDGVRDGAENGGVVTSFADGVLKIDLANGTSVSGHVTADTEIECEGADDRGRNGNRGPGSAHDSRHGGDDGPNHDAGDDHGDDGADDNGASCTAADLTAGTRVHEAELKTTADGLVFEKVELLK